jgi:hypothetical protein
MPKNNFQYPSLGDKNFELLSAEMKIFHNQPAGLIHQLILQTGHLFQAALLHTTKDCKAGETFQFNTQEHPS